MKNLHIFYSPFTHESRALKQSNSLIDNSLFDEVIFAASWFEGLDEYEQIDEKRRVWRVKLVIPEVPIIKRFRYFEWMFRIFLSTCFSDVVVVQAHSLRALPVAALIKFLRGSKLVYDAHELETEVNELKPKRKVIYKLIEKYLIRYVDSLTVVSDSIADWYAEKYNITRPYVVRNIPFSHIPAITTNPVVSFREKFCVSEQSILFIFVGGFSKGRGLEIILDVFSKVDEDRHIVFMGFGGIEDTINEYVSKFKNIHLHPAVKPDEVISYTENADIGLSLTENLCLNHYFSLPNKVFQYIISGLPIIVSDFPEMGKLVDDYNCGWKVDVDSDSLLKLINNITWEDIEQKKDNAKLAKQSLGWEYEGQKFVDIYKSVMNI